MGPISCTELCLRNRITEISETSLVLSSFPRSFSTTVCGACDGVGAGPPGEVGDDDVVNFIALVTFSSSSRVCSCSRCSCVGCKKGLLFTVTVSLLATLSFIDDDAISFLLCVCLLAVVVATKITQKRRARVGVCVVIFFLAQLLFFFLMRDALELFVFTQPGWMDGAGRPVWVAPPPLEKREKRKKNFFTVRRTKRLARARNEQIAYNLTLSGIITT